LSIMHIATCFDSRASSSGYSMNHNIDTSSDSAQNVHCHLMYLCYGSLNSLMMTPYSRNMSLYAQLARNK